MVKQASLADDLRAIAGADHVREPKNAEDCAVDGVTPKAIVEPRTYEEVAGVVRYGNERRLAIIPWGGGTTMHVGNVPSRYDIALSTRRLNRIIEHEPADLTVTCQAGITVKSLNDALAKHGQMAPFEQYLAKGSTAGGALAANRSGASRHHTGTPRDFTIGMRLVTGDGLIVRAGGKVVKNVAGYDMCKLFIGSRGTLGVIVEATFKLAPQVRQCDRIDWFASVDDACRIARELTRRGLGRAFVVTNSEASQSLTPDAPSTATLYTDFGLENGPSLERAMREYHALIDGVGVSEPAPEEPWAVRGGLAGIADRLQLRVAVLPSDIPATIRRLEELISPVHVYAQPVTGEMTAVAPDLDREIAALTDVRHAISEMGGTLVVESCPADLKADLDIFGEPPASFPLMRAVKQQFDPNDVLSPGRFVGRL